MAQIFYKDDFKVLFHRTDAMGNILAIPTHDWKATVYTEFGYANQGVVASSIKGVVTGAVVKEKEIVFAIDNHNLQPGRVMIDWEEFIPDTDFPDGTRRVFRTYNSGSELVLTEGDSQTAIVNALLPYQYDSAYQQAVQGGYKGTQEEYFALASQLPNAVEVANSVKGSADSLAESAEQIGGNIEALNGVVGSIEKGANTIESNADTLQASANIVKTSAEQIGGKIQSLDTSIASIDVAIANAIKSVLTTKV